MHLLMIITAIGLACLIRFLPLASTTSWQQKWQQVLFSFLFPPLLLLTTAIAVICMGYHGQMLGLQASWYSYSLAIGFLTVAVIFLVKLSYQGYNSLQTIYSYPQTTIAQKQARIINTSFPYCAQIGFWQPQLVISQGLIDSLDQEHLQAVLAHENAHHQYHDTFWFFWLGWLRFSTNWLPNTEKLWQELLFLREVRADQIASHYVDSLLLAESLLIVNKNIYELSHFSDSEICAAFHDCLSQNRLQERIDNLLTDVNISSSSLDWNWLYLTLVFLPLMTIPLHG